MDDGREGADEQNQTLLEPQSAKVLALPGSYVHSVGCVVTSLVGLDPRIRSRHLKR